MIIRHDRSDRHCLVNPKDWPGFTSFFRGHGGALLIAPTWLLTAAHVATLLPVERHPSIEVAEERRSIVRVVIHPEFAPEWSEEDADNGRHTVDLALVELDVSITHVPPYELYTDNDEVGQEVILLGSGQFGDGKRGAGGIDRGLRRATNKIDAADDYWLAFRFDEPPDCTELEGVSGAGDSGGPAFIQRDGRLLLAGISSWQHFKGNAHLGMYGCVEHYSRVSRFIDWIQVSCRG